MVEFKLPRWLGLSFHVVGFILAKHSVQAIEPIRAPKEAANILMSLVEIMLTKAKHGVDYQEEEIQFDQALFDIFGFTNVEREYITQQVQQYRQ